MHAVTDLRYNRGTIEEMVELVDRYLHMERVGRYVLVAHSKGGLVGKLLLSHHNEDRTIHGLVAVNTPFAGSPLDRVRRLAG